MDVLARVIPFFLLIGVGVLIAWVGLKLGLEYMHDLGYFPLEISQWVSIGLVVAIFIVSLIIAKNQGPPRATSRLTERAEEMLEGREESEG